MALYKEIRQEDGVTTKYHRILFTQNMVNDYNSVAVVSYTDKESRENDIPSEGNNRPYRKVATYQMDYDENMTVTSAYDYLKTLPLFQGAEDI